MSLRWENIQTIGSKHYICGHCGEAVSSEKAFICRDLSLSITVGTIYICHHCLAPTYFDRSGNQTPGEIFGTNITDISDDPVKELYIETRRCISVNAYTSAVLSSRKLLMHIAVAKGAKEGLKFIEYVEYLSANHFIPPDAKEWVDHIREKGNEANHEIIIMSEEDAKDLIDFIGMILKIVYEFPAKIKKKIDNSNQ